MECNITRCIKNGVGGTKSRVIAMTYNTMGKSIFPDIYIILDLCTFSLPIDSVQDYFYCNNNKHNTGIETIEIGYRLTYNRS